MLDKRLDRTEVSLWEQANAALLPPTATSDWLIELAKPDWLLRRINAGRKRIPLPAAPFVYAGGNGVARRKLRQPPPSQCLDQSHRVFAPKAAAKANRAARCADQAFGPNRRRAGSGRKR